MSGEVELGDISTTKDPGYTAIGPSDGSETPGTTDHAHGDHKRPGTILEHIKHVTIDMIFTKDM
jgi:hypothetical protein